MSLQDQVNAIQATQNSELPRRIAKPFPSDIGSYDGDPNLSSEPYLVNATVLTRYHEPTADKEWRKKGDGTWEISGAGVVFGTQEDITVPVVAYDDAGITEVPTGQLLTTQAAWDAALGAGTGFPNPAEVIEAMGIISHTVTINCGKGVIRGRTSGDTHVFRTEFGASAGKITINGVDSSQWDALDVSLENLTVNSAVLSGTPSVTFAGTPFSAYPNSALTTYHYVDSVGNIAVIAYHDDSTLYLQKNLSVDPSAGTASVMTPGSRLAVTNDGTTPSGNLGVQCINVSSGTPATTRGRLDLNDLWFDAFGAAPTPLLRLENFFVISNRCRLGAQSNSNVLGVSNPSGGLVQMADWGISGAVGGGADKMTVLTSSFYRLRNTVVAYCEGIQCLGQIASRGSIDLWSSAFVNPQNDGSPVLDLNLMDVWARTLSGPKCRFQNLASNQPAISLKNSTWNNGYDGVEFADCDAACIVIGEGTNATMTDAFTDAGGNTDVGWDIVGPGANISIDSSSDVTGTVGDIRIGGVIKSYAELATAGSLIDDGLNVIRRV